jgi:hypothetical protein
VIINASPATTSAKTTGVVLMALGGAAALGCGIGLPVAVQSGSGTAPGVGAGLTLGLISMAVGIPVYAFNRTTYTLAGLGAFHF